MEELDFYRNENNTGPVIRVYAVRTKEQNPQILKEYGEAMPHTKYGKTIIYFFGVDFSKDVNLKEGPDHLGQELRPLVNFTFSKSPMGQSSLKDKFVK